MNKENIAQIILNNYIALAKEMNPTIKEDEMELLSYLEALNKQVFAEMRRIENNNAKTSEIFDEKISVSDQTISTTLEQQNTDLLEEPTSSYTEQNISENEDEYSEETITMLAQQLIETGTLHTLTPIDETLSEKIMARVKELQNEQTSTKKNTFFQSAAEKLKKNGIIRNISFREKFLSIFLSKRQRKQNASQVEILEELDQDYIEEMARTLVETGELKTLAPISEKYGEAIAKRAAELRKERGINESTVPVQPTPVPRPTPTLTAPNSITISTSTVPYSVTKPDVAKKTDDLDQDYIEEMARTLVETGELKTLAPISEKYGEAIAKRAAELRKERGINESTVPVQPTPTLTAPNPITISTSTVPYSVTKPDVAKKTDDLDQDYIEEMARTLVKRGKLVTFAPIPEKYGNAIAKRAEEIRREERQTSSDDLESMFEESEVLTETDQIQIKR